MTRFLVLFLCTGLMAACVDMPEPRHAEFNGPDEYRNLSLVPPRPKVNVPLGEREQMEKELATDNATAQQNLLDAGFEPTLPSEKPAVPPEVE